MLFFFDTDDGERRTRDASGTDLRDEDEAVEQALALLRDLAHAGVAPGASRSFVVTVRDARREGLYAASLDLKLERLG